MPPQRIDWQTELREQRGSRTVRVYRVTCTDCGYERTLRSPDAKKAERSGACFRCSQRAKARQGFAAMARVWGQRWAMRHVQAYREANPSGLELQMAALLDALGVTYRREVDIATKAKGRRKRVYLVDFMVYHDGREWVVQVDGYWHRHNAATMQRDRLLNRFLKRRRIPLLRVTDIDLNEGRVLAMLVAFLGFPAGADADAPDGVAPEPIYEMAVWTW